VITMIGILATMSLGRSTKILTGWRLTRAAQAFAAELQQGFAIVGRSRKPVVFEFRADSMNLTIKSRPDAITGKPTVYRRRNFGPGSEFKLSSGDFVFNNNTNTNATSVTLEVYPPGLAADSLSVVISRAGQGRRLRLLRGGLAQVCTSLNSTTC
jgi:hypothetical protein